MVGVWGQNTVLMCVFVAVTGTTLEDRVGYNSVAFASLARASNAAFLLACVTHERFRYLLHMPPLYPSLFLCFNYSVKF